MNNLVAASLDTEAVDIVSREHCGEVVAGSRQIYSLGANLVAIEHHFGLGLIEFQVRIRVEEHSTREGLLHELVRQFLKPFGFVGRRDHKIDGEIAATRQRRRCLRDGANPRDLRQWSVERKK